QYFSKQTGMTLQKCILKMKIHESENMLRYTHQSVGEISTSLAFCSQSYFTEVFKKINGMTPADFRKRYKQSIKSE
ncbi:MAG TPA: AraC family transcriptional regulator, partial [Bacillota bacterium]|nr:AraC family transcriptional regulator [Bacillota bacterium]